MMENSVNRPSTVKTLTRLHEEYLTYIKSRNMSKYTLKHAKHHIRLFINWISGYGIETADRISSRNLQSWTQHLLDHRTTRGMPLKPRSINRQITTLRSFLQYLVRHGYIQSIHLESLENIKEPKLLPTSVLTHREVKKLIRYIPTSSGVGYRNRALLELLYTTGIRIGELLALDLRDIDLKNRTAIVLGKGNKQRVVPIGKTALRCLESYLKAVRPYLECDRSEQAVFLHTDGNRLAYHTVRNMIKRYAAAANLDVTVTAHTFRRSCTTELIRSGANMYHVKELLGHERLDTLNHYARLTISDLKATHEKYHPREKDA